MSTRASGGMADALASGASEGNLVGVQVPPRPPLSGTEADHMRAQASTTGSVGPAVHLETGAGGSERSTSGFETSPHPPNRLARRLRTRTRSLAFTELSWARRGTVDSGNDLAIRSKSSRVAPWCTARAWMVSSSRRPRRRSHVPTSRSSEADRAALTPGARRCGGRMSVSTRMSSTSPMVRCWVMASRSGRWAWIW